MQVWITKYALTKGIFTAEVNEPDEGSTMVVDRSTGWGAYYHGNDWHRTEDAAVVRANQLRDDTIKSREKSIAKLRRLKFG